MQPWRWIKAMETDGATQMAVDYSLCLAASSTGVPAMRVYAWKPACISLGHHQSADAIDFDRCRRDGIDVVRRATGGRAVLHDQEVTYAMAIPGTDSLFSDSIAVLHHRIAAGLVAAFRKLGIPAALEKRALDLSAHYSRPSSMSCFSAAARHEIMVGGKKMVGSAQRRISGAVLQHGSILLGDAHCRLPDYLKALSPEEKERLRGLLRDKTATVSSCLKREAAFGEVAGALRSGMEEALSIRFTDSDLEPEEKTKSREILGQFLVFQSGPEEAR